VRDRHAVFTVKGSIAVSLISVPGRSTTVPPRSTSKSFHRHRVPTVPSVPGVQEGNIGNCAHSTSAEGERREHDEIIGNIYSSLLRYLHSRRAPCRSQPRKRKQRAARFLSDCVHSPCGFCRHLSRTSLIETFDRSAACAWRIHKITLQSASSTARDSASASDTRQS